MSSQPNRTDRTRDGQGKYSREVATAERDAEAMRMRAQGKTYQQIADHFGITKGSAHEAVTRAMAETVREPAEQAIAYSRARLDEARDRLNGMRDIALDLLSRKHITVSQGKAVYDDVTGQAVEDDDFVLRALDRLAKIEAQLQSNDESRRKLEGLDQPAKTQLSGALTYQVVGINPEDLA